MTLLMPLLVSLLCTLALAACSNDLVPVDARLTISPGTHTTRITELTDTDGRCLYSIANHVDIPIVLQLTTSGGSPIGDAELQIYADFAANTYSGVAVLALYDDLNSNGVVDADIELISGVDDDIARVSTDRWSGSRYLLLRINLSCGFQGEIVAFTGGVSARASIEVIADEAITY